MPISFTGYKYIVQRTESGPSSSTWTSCSQTRSLPGIWSRHASSVDSGVHPVRPLVCLHLVLHRQHRTEQWGNLWLAPNFGGSDQRAICTIQHIGHKRLYQRSQYGDALSHCPLLHSLLHDWRWFWKRVCQHAD